MKSTKIRSKIIPSGCLSGFELRYKDFLLKLFQSDADLTLCIPRQSSKAVSWCRLNSVEFNSRWIPKRSLCITRGTRGDGDAVPNLPQPSVLISQTAFYLSSGENWRGEPQQTLDLDLHGGQGALTDCQ